MRHLYADFIDRVAKPARYLGGEYQAVVKDGAVDARVCLAFPDVYDIGMSPPRHQDPLLAAQQAIRGSRASARSRRGSTWRPSCARAACRWCRSRAQRPLREFDVRRHLAAVRADVHERAHAARPRRHPAARRRSRRGRDRSSSSAARPRRTPSRSRRSSTPRSSARPRSCCRRSCSRGRAMRARDPRRRAHAARRARRARARGSRLRAVAVRDRDRRRDRHDRRRRAARSARAGARRSARWSRDLDAYPFPTDTPVPYAEAVFERVSVEIARGCTEGCRFCQAGMIYRPVRERVPQSIVDVAARRRRERPATTRPA